MFIATIWFVLLAFRLLNCLQMIPERANITYFNHKYMEYARFYISRHGRKSPYYINVELKAEHAWANNVTVDLVFFEYLHNEYRRSFVEMHMKFCNMINSDPYLGRMLFKHGVRCPAPAGIYHLQNMTVPTENFAYQFPFTKAKIEIDVTTEKAGTILKAYITAAMITKKKKNS